MTSAAYKKNVSVSITGNSGWEVVPCESPSMDNGRELLDSTTTKSASAMNAFRKRTYGLKDWSVNCDSMWGENDAALLMIRNAMNTEGPLFVRYVPDSGVIATGLQGPVLVETFNMGGGVGDLETVGITLQANGALGDATA